MAALTQSYHIDLTAPTDDRPFFFNQLVLTDWASIREARNAEDGVIRGNLEATKTIGVIVLLSAILVLITMIIPSLPAVRRAQASLAWFGTLYFALIGLGFMFIEIGIIQRVSLFLGHPVYGLAIGLFSIILSTGIGSLISELLRLDTAGKLVAWSVSLCALVILLSFWFPAVVGAFEGHSLVVRVVVSLAAIVPSGLLMGFGFPTGMRLANMVDTRPTPWFWAINGSAGVLAASIAVGYEHRLFDQCQPLDWRGLLSPAGAGEHPAAPDHARCSQGWRRVAGSSLALKGDDRCRYRHAGRRPGTTSSAGGTQAWIPGLSPV